ncbi:MULTISPECIES: sensor histidine kinase [Streptomyces]|uniref:Oxygen sensor histidine kinase NreB n=1 Tax=Streptomyces solicathayae TaxID=3081768 RepID=A0ABZ0M1B2_9ACTN|nr:sensor histidine kinase [Streptomyces sp. HUAS YS2]WOX25489.1 sensor histidine kinase [Streptomyces sp. HUAS YS2]
MSADLPLEEPGRRLNGPDGPRESDVHTRTFRNWDLYFAVVWAGTLAFALGAEHPAWPVRAAAACVFALQVPWYLLVGRPQMVALAPAGPRAVLHVGGAVLLFLVPALLVGETRLATFALVPQCFMLLRLRTAQLVVAVVNVAPVVGWALLWRPQAGVVFLDSVFAVVSLCFSLVLGTWIIRVVDQSEERAALIAELDAHRLEVARLSAANGARAERERFSREIHDTLAQGFTSLLMLVQAVQSELDRDPAEARRHLAMMAETARQNLAEARALVAHGAPADLAGTTLPNALRRLVAGHYYASRFKATGSEHPLPAALEVIALRSCQEALANVRRHAGDGAGVLVSLAYGEDELTLSVRDDGHGFDPLAPHEGYGLRGLRARAAEVGGTAEIRSAPGAGTTVTVRLPVPARSAP